MYLYIHMFVHISTITRYDYKFDHARLIGEMSRRILAFPIYILIRKKFTRNT
jgi:hypothetical protein